MRIRQVLGPLFADEEFADLFPRRGQPAWPPGQLAMVSVLQFLEGLSDRQAAAAVRGRIDWKLLLGLELTDPGFDHSLLSEFRDRLVTDGRQQRVLDAVLHRLREKDLLKRPGRQRTDSTHVLAAIRTLNRLETAGETLRAALNALAAAAPDWLSAWVPAEWFDRYERRIEDYRLPQGKQDRAQYAEQIGGDGAVLLGRIHAAEAPPWLREIPAVQTLRICWIHQYYVDDGQWKWRQAKDLPPARRRIDSPYDPQAHYATKRSIAWSGYKAHLTESCDDDAPHLITHVATTDAPAIDAETTAAIHADLAARDLLPGEHLVDTGYTDARLLVASKVAYGMELLGPVQTDVQWQSTAKEGFDLTAFTIDWDAEQATCPQGHTSVKWLPHRAARGRAVIHVDFHQRDCGPCPVRAKCTRAKTEPRELTLRTRAEHEALQQARRDQTTEQWKARYNARAGIEGTISQAVRAFGLRRCRYRGRTKTHVQDVLTASALNLARTDAWLIGTPLAHTRTSRFARLHPAP
jgi:transposase